MSLFEEVTVKAISAVLLKFKSREVIKPNVYDSLETLRYL